MNISPVEQGHLLTELAWWSAQEDQPAIVNGADGTPILTLPLRDEGTIYAIILIQNPQRAMPADWLFAAAMVARAIPSGQNWQSIVIAESSRNG